MGSIMTSLWLHDVLSVPLINKRAEYSASTLVNATIYIGTMPELRMLHAPVILSIVVGHKWHDFIPANEHDTTKTFFNTV